MAPVCPSGSTPPESLTLILLIRNHNALLTVPAWPQSNNDHAAQPPDLTRVVDIDWSRFAYTQYVTNSDYLCNSVMLFETLHRLGSKADRVMMYPSYMVDPEASEANTNDARLLIKARDQYPPTYSRVLSLDSDSVIMQTMDELFLLPPCSVAMPRAYWLYPDKKILSSQFQRVMDRIKSANGIDYDMEIVNGLYQDSALVLPHRPYNLITGEFRTDDHTSYLDWPVPKPWILMPDDLRGEKQPKEIWNNFYNGFQKRREVITLISASNIRFHISPQKLLGGIINASVASR
ncbi:glycosyltransferase family 8 protein [Hirsutella rhossiliensis]